MIYYRFNPLQETGKNHFLKMFGLKKCLWLQDRGNSGFYSDINTWWRGEGTCVNGSWTAFAKSMAKAKLKKRNNSTIV